MKTNYITPAVTSIRMVAEQTMVDLSYGNQEGDGEQRAKMTPFDDIDEPEVAEAPDYFEEATKLHVSFKDIWADEE